MADDWTPSITLCVKVKDHLTFLKKVNDNHLLHQEAFIRNAIRRYECMWLPLLRKNEGKTLEPPLDVHWIWHCHMLSPLQYRRDCEQLIGMVPDHDFSPKVINDKVGWKDLFPHEPFHVDFNAPPAFRGEGPHVSHIGYDLVAAAKRQKAFYYNVSLPHYSDVKFLMTAVRRYIKFVKLKKNNPSAFIVPMYDVDLMWHTHQLYPHVYYKDTQAFLGSLLNHDDEMTDRSPGSKLVKADQQTRYLWMESYQEHFPVAGALYRGESPVGKLYPTNISDILPDVNFSAKFTIRQLTLYGGKKKYKASGVIRSMRFQTPLNEAKGLPLIWKSETSQGIVTFLVNSSESTVPVSMQLFRRDGLKQKLGIGTQKQLCDISIDLRPCLDGIRAYDAGREMVFSCNHDSFKLEVCGTLSDAKPDDVRLKMTTGTFIDYTIPEDREEFWGPIQVPQLPQEVPNTCRVSTQSITLNDRPLFKVRIIHSLPLQMSAVQIFFNDKMVATSQLVGSEQLPTPNQVQTKNSCVTLNTKAGERAMLIKNSKGDWGIMTAHWDGIRKGTKRRPGSRGYLKLCIRHLTNGMEYSDKTIMESNARTTEKEFLSRLQSISLFREKGIDINMRDSEILVGEDCRELAEMVAAAYSIVILILLCEPQPDLFLNHGQPTEPKSRTSYSSYDVPFIHSCGYMEPKYCNNWQYWHRKNSRHSNDHWYGRNYWYDDYFETTTSSQVEESGQSNSKPDGIAYCPWDPNDTEDYCNDETIAWGGGNENFNSGRASPVICVGCGACDTGGGGGGGREYDGGGWTSSSVGGGGGGCASSCGGGGCGSSCGGGGGGCGSDD